LRGEVRGEGKLLAAFTYDTGADPAHDHVVFEMSSGAAVVYNDPRRFGYMQLIAEAELDRHPLFAGLGVEPLGNALTADHLATRAQGRTTDLKAFLMDQRNIAGLGNIYVCEALHRAGLSPNRAASALADRRGRSTQRTERLVPAIRAVLEEAIAAGGSTLRDYKQADGALGYFQHRFRVYGRDGETCARAGCGGTVRRIVQGGRSTFFCGRCQR
jgi:formamidopyrimidine-DNA glycosylase